MNAGSSKKQYDAIIIGSGIGGLVTGAILSEKEGWEILVLEKEGVIGGKCYSFEHFDGDENTFHKILYNNVRSKIVDASPSISELIEKKEFSKYIFEGGWHSFIGADRSRIAFIASALNENLKIYPNAGFRLLGDGKWQGLRYLMRNWTDYDFEEGKRVAREMNYMSLEESSAYDQIGLRSYLKSRTRSKNVQRFHEWLAGWEAGVNDPELISAGEHIKVVSMVNCSGRNFEYGGGGQPAGGFNAMTRLFAGIIEKNGGKIQTQSCVKEILIKDYIAVGVRTDGEELLSPHIICNVPMQRALSLVDQDFWPMESIKQVNRTVQASGLLGWVSLKRPLDPEYKGIYVVPVLPGCSASDGFCGDVLFTFEDVAAYDATRAPIGEGLMPIWAALLADDPDELHNPVLVNKVIKAIFDFFNATYNNFKENLNWYCITACDELYSNSMSPGMVGNRRLPVKHPLVDNLFFTGDSVTQWSFGVSGAVGGAVNCASAASGKDFSTLLPFYMR